MVKLPAQDIVERLLDRAKRMNGALVGASDGGTYALGYYDQFAAADDKEAAATISRLTADNEALREEVVEAAEARAAHHRTSHKAVKRLRALWREKQAATARADALAQEVERLKEALTPSADTKAAYWGEFYMGVTLRAGREEDYRRVQIPWDSIKEIMSAISARSALGDRP